MEWIARIMMVLAVLALVVMPVARAKADTLADRGIEPATSYKNAGENNPLYTQRFGADPGVMEYNGRLYVFMTNDIIEYDAKGNVKENGYGQIRHISCCPRLIPNTAAIVPNPNGPPSSRPARKTSARVPHVIAPIGTFGNLRPKPSTIVSRGPAPMACFCTRNCPKQKISTPARKTAILRARSPGPVPAVFPARYS